jgi:uncharacterized protein (DUF1501 family)
MLTLTGPSHRYCDRLSRRSFLKVGSLALGGLTLPQLLQAEAKSPGKKNHKSVIMVYLSGGISHIDTFDLKPKASADIRGEFKPIDTNVSGIQICEHLPKLARIMDKIALIRSLVGQLDEHTSFQNLTGYPMNLAKRENKPNFGAVIAKTQGQVDPVVPAFVDLFPTMQHKPYNSPSGGHLGRAAGPMKLDGGDLAVMKLGDMQADRLEARRKLLSTIDNARGGDSSLDPYYQRAFDVLASNKLVDALDIAKEPTKVRERYGRGSPRHQGDGAPQWNDQLLMARRLVEAGARCVTVAYGFWDTHGGNFTTLKRQLPLLDQGISALIEDIHLRGMEKDVTIVVWGEFGRTPKIVSNAGRDHWARVNGVLLAGGGMRTGQVIGATDKIAAAAFDQPIHYRDVLATVYHNLGIDPHAMVNDVTGRPIPVLPSTVQPIGKLVG